MTATTRALHKREEAFLKAVNDSAQLATLELVQLRKRVMQGGQDVTSAALGYPISEVIVMAALAAIGTPIADERTGEPDEDGLTPVMARGRRVLASRTPLALELIERHGEYVAYLPGQLAAAPAGPPASGEVRSVMEALHRLGRGNIKASELGVRQYELILLSTGRITDTDLAMARAMHKRLRYVDLSSEPPSLDVHDSLSARVIDDHHVIPWRREQGKLIVLTANPYPSHLRGTIEVDSGETVELAVASESRIKALIQDRYHSPRVFAELREEAREHPTPQTAAPEEEPETDSSVIRAVNSIIETAVQKGASDIHLQPSADGLSVRLRVNGRLISYQTLPESVTAQLLTRVKLMAGMRVEQRDLPQDKRIHYQHGQVDAVLRVNTLRAGSRGLEKIVMRVAPRNRPIPSLDALDLAARNRAVMEEALSLKEGLILMTGPTGSGKTTTTYAMLTRLNREDVNVQTIEQPIEYDLPGITQTAVNPEAQSADRRLDYDRALEALMRQDPDVIMVGEIRTRTTAATAAQAALTGHLVISTLHTNGAVATVRRLLDLGLESFTVADTLRVVISQRLAGRPCPRCSVEVPAPEQWFGKQPGRTILRSLGRLSAHGEPDPAGTVVCPHCDGTLVGGRIGIHEVLRVTPAVQQAIYAGQSGQVIEGLARADGMRSLLEDGLAKVLAHEATLESLLASVTAHDTPSHDAHPDRPEANPTPAA